MKRASLLALIALSSLALAGTPHQNKKDIVKGSKTVKGTFIGFEQGDYLHARVKTAKGEQSFFIGGDGLEYFLCDHANKPGTFKYELVSSFIEEAGGRMDIERLVSVKIGSASSATWYKALRKKKSFEAIDKMYQAKIEKLTKGG